MIPTVLGVSLVVMGMVRLLPGDAVQIMVSENASGGAREGFEVVTTEELADPSWPGVEPVENPDEAGFQRSQDAGLDAIAATDSARALAEEEGVDLTDTEARREFISSIPTAQRNDMRDEIALEAYADTIRERIGLDKNFFHQWGDWVLSALQGDFGTSLLGSRSVNDELARRLPVTLQLGLLSMVFGGLIAIPTGIVSAVKQDSMIDYVVRSFAVALIALPSFFVAILLIAILSRQFGYAFPLYYATPWDDPWANAQQVVAAAFVLGLSFSGTLMRLTRAEMLEVLRQDFIRTARSKGLVPRAVVMSHAVRNAMLPIVTIIGVQFPVVIGGSVVIEVIFGLPGVAAYLYTAIQERDFPPMMAVIVIIACVVVIANLIVDVLYAYLDPRVKLS